MPPLPSRKRRLWLIAANTFIAGAVAAYLASHTSEFPGSLFARSFDGPKLAMPTCTATELGDGRIGEVLDGVIPVRNAGGKPLVFRIDASCACAYVEPAFGTIEPGETTEIHVGVRLRNQGQEENVLVRIYTNDETLPVGQHLLTARCPAIVVLKPSGLDFGEVPEGETRSLALHVCDGTGRPLGPSSNCQVVSSHQAVRVTRQTDHEHLKFLVTLQDDAPRGVLHAMLRVLLQDKEFETTIPVIASITGLVTVAPSSLFLYRDPRSATYSDMLFIVRKTTGEPVGEVVSLETSPWLSVESLDGPASRRSRFRVRVVPMASVQPAGHVRLRLGGVPEDIIVRVSARISQTEQRDP